MDQPPPTIATPQRPHNPLANYHFSSEELRVLRECNTESFFQRSLPIGCGLGVAAYFGVKNGYLQPNVKYGAVPKVVVGVIIGYFLGKFSYQQKCAEKLMRLPNSKLADLLRQRKQQSGGGVMGRLTPDQDLSVGLALAPFTNKPDIYSDEEAYRNSRSSALNLDTDTRPTISGLDDIYRPSLDSSAPYTEPEIPIEPAKSGMTYEELRKKNREEYLKKQQNLFARPLPSEAPVVLRQREPPNATIDEGREPRSTKGQTNKYGDTWTE